MFDKVPVADLYKDPTNPRKADDARLQLLRLSISKLGFILPVCAVGDGMLLSGHQRLTVAQQLGIKTVPVQYVDLNERDIRGINVLFNRATNDFTAFDTGSGSLEKLNLRELAAMADDLVDWSDEEFWAYDTRIANIKNLGKGASDRYEKKSIVVANNLLRKGIQVPIVLSESGEIVNGVHRLFAAREAGIEEWPVLEIPDSLAELSLNMLNYLSMDYHVDDEFADMLRYSAYRRPQNNRGSVPKSYRFWANGERTLPDKDSYSRDYWRHFRTLHGHSIMDFGAGLCKVAPFLATKGIDCVDFEPYRINPDAEKGEPDPDYSKEMAKEFLEIISDSSRKFDSIFLASVMNSIPFPKDRMAVLAIVHALCSFETTVYGTCRDISDFHYEYGGIRNANYFVFESEPGVRLGDALHRPKIQKFHSQEEAQDMFSKLWNTVDFWSGGNVFYFRLKSPKRVNTTVLGKALEIEFELPYSDGTRMGLMPDAKHAFARRLGARVP